MQSDFAIWSGFAALLGSLAAINYWGDKVWQVFLGRIREATLRALKATDKPFDPEEERRALGLQLEAHKHAIAQQWCVEADLLISKLFERYLEANVPGRLNPSQGQMLCIWTGTVISAAMIFYRCNQPDGDIWAYHFGTILQVVAVAALTALTAFGLRPSVRRP